MNNNLRAGLIFPFAGSTAPSGWLKCDGSAISRTTYASLFSVIGTTYGAGDGSTTFNIPNFINRTFWGGSSSGAVKNAGLPNITGKLGVVADATDRNGAFSSQSTSGRVTLGSSTGTGRNVIYMAASNSNSIYGASTTVQPPAVQTLICIKY